MSYYLLNRGHTLISGPGREDDGPGEWSDYSKSDHETKGHYMGRSTQYYHKSHGRTPRCGHGPSSGHCRDNYSLREVVRLE